ncbi:MAG: TolC family protein [Bacteroidia bacterium]
MIRQKKYFLIPFLGLLCSVAFSQTDSIITLKQALQLAIKNYPLLQAKEYEVKAADEELKATRRGYLPALGVSGQLSYATDNSLPGTYFPMGIVPSTSAGISAKENTEAAFGSIALGYFEWTPIRFGKYRAKINESKAELIYANADDANELFTDQVNVAGAYFKLLALQKIVETDQKNIFRAEEIKHIIASYATNGLKPGVDTSFANSEISKAKINFLNDEQISETQKNTLANLMGIANVNFKLDSVFTQHIPIVSADTITTNLGNNPLIQLYNSEVKISEAQSKYIAKSYFPNISLLGITDGRGSGIGYNGIYNNAFSDGTKLSRYNYALGISCTFNILDYPRIKSETEAQKFRTKALQSELSAQNVELKNQLLLSYNTIQSALEEAKEAPIQFSAASDAYRQKLAMYNSGLTSIADVAQTLYNLNRAESDQAIANEKVWDALLYIAATKGDLTILFNNIK